MTHRAEDPIISQPGEKNLVPHLPQSKYNVSARLEGFDLLPGVTDSPATVCCNFGLLFKFLVEWQRPYFVSREISGSLL